MSEPNLPRMPGREMLRELRGESIPPMPKSAPAVPNPAAHKKEVISTLLWTPVILAMLFFAGREVFRLLLNLWHHSHLWIFIPLGIVVVPLLLYALAFVVGFVFVLLTGKK